MKNASITKRLLGFLIDTLFIAIFIFIISGTQKSLSPFGLLIIFGYYFLLEAIFDRTIGKLIVGTIVVDKVKVYSEGSMFKKVFIRTLCRFIPLYQLSILWGAPWHDDLSNTLVIDRNTLPKGYFNVL